MLTEWVLVSLPNFTRRAPLSHSIWCLTCFFIAASTNPHLQVLYHNSQNWMTWNQIFCLHKKICLPVKNNNNLPSIYNIKCTFKAIYPHLLYRDRKPDVATTTTSTAHEDRRLFCLAGADFFGMLTGSKGTEILATKLPLLFLNSYSLLDHITCHESQQLIG